MQRKMRQQYLQTVQTNENLVNDPNHHASTYEMSQYDDNRNRMKPRWTTKEVLVIEQVRGIP